MLLLPSLIKLATGCGELSYQVAPGIAIHASSAFSELREVAVNTAFLVDGDSQGRIWKEQLIKAGVPESQIAELPADLTLEDLLPAEMYASALRDLMDLGREELPGSGLTHPYRANASAIIHGLGRRVPGPIALAEHILTQMEDPLFELMMSDKERAVLSDLHTRLLAALVRPAKHGS